MTSDNTVQIREAMEAWSQAIRDKDAGAALRHYTDDVVTFDR